MLSSLRTFVLGSIRRQIILGVALVHAVLMAGFIWDLLQRQQHMVLEHRVDEAQALSSSLAATSAGWVVARDLGGLRELVEAQQRYPDLAYAMILDRAGRVLAHTDTARAGQHVLDLPSAVQPALMTRSHELVDAMAPVQLSGQHLGWARVGLAPGEVARQEQASIKRSGLWYAAAAIALGSVLAAWMAGRLTRRLALIRQVADDVKRGDHSRRVVLAGTDEAAHVAVALNRMLDGMAAAQQALIDSEQRLLMALDAADMRAWRWDGATDRTEWDGDPQRLLGPPPTAGYPGLHQMVVPEDQARFEAAGRAALAGATDYRVEFRLRRTDGPVRWLVTRGCAMRDAAGRAMYLYGITQDVTAHKAAEQLLHDSEARANLIIDGSPDALLIVGAQGRILRINSRAEEMFGYAADELVGQGIECLVPPDVRHRHPQDRAAFVASGSTRVMAELADVRALRKDGSTFPAQVNLAALGSGPAAEVIATVRDETQSRALQADLVRHRDHLEELVVSRTVELTAARNEAERLARVKSEFLANMSHEIRTPLNAIFGLAQIGLLNRAGQHSGETLRAFAGIMEAGQHLLGVINDILDFSRLDAGKLVVEHRPFALTAAVDNAARMLAGAAQAKGLRFDVSMAPDLPTSVCGDPQRLQQVLVNLLANAVKFTEAGAVQLRVARAGAGAEEAAADDVCFSVIDAGIGMTAEQVQRLFLPFEQADNSATRRFGGSGLGLAISHNLALLMGGDISVESAPGRGSSFTLRLPLPPAETAGPRAQASPVAAQPGPGPGGRLAGLRVLAAEDVEVNRVVLEAMLEHEGAQVSFAENGQQVLDRLQSQPAGAFDVVLMDVQMPVMDGYEATRRVRVIAPGLPVIGLTAHALADERARCLAAGMSAHVSKPVDLDALVAEICKFTMGRG